MTLLWVLTLIYTVRSKPLETCTLIPPGSIWYQPQNELNFTFIAPAIAGRCQTEFDGKSVHSQMFNCTGSTAYYLRFDNETTCQGTPDIVNPVKINGSCVSGPCGVYNSFIYIEQDCKGPVLQNVTNQYVYWDPDVCYGGIIEKCENGFPHYIEYKNLDCTGEVNYDFIASGQCIKGNGDSYKATGPSNPCKAG